jgi:hypothetical protein
MTADGSPMGVIAQERSAWTGDARALRGEGMRVAISGGLRYVLSMSTQSSQSDRRRPGFVRQVRDALAPRACSAIVFGALFCNLAVKFFHAVRYGQLLKYPTWILTDIAMLFTIQVILSLICYRWPTKRVVRGAMIFAALVCVAA